MKAGRLIAAGWLAALACVGLGLRAAEPCESVPTFADGNAPVREVFVGPGGSDSSGDGTRARPFRTLARAASGTRPGTALRLLPGTHAGGHVLAGLSGTAEAPVWIGGVPGEARPVIAGGAQALHLSRVRYLVVEHLEIAGATANGINCDDGGEYGNPEASRFLVFRHLVFRDIGTGGNQDALKLSGVNDYRVLDCVFQRGSAGGSGIDHVGCHRGVIARCRFESMGSNSIQCKGGSEDIEIRWCRFLNGGQRAVNVGGSTGFEFFRPPLSLQATNAEARDIRVIANVFQGSDAPVAFVGCDNALVANNTIVDPTRWVARILQETVSSGGYTFLPAGNSRFVNNLVSFRRAQLSTFVNIGPNTLPASFGFANNLWYAHDNPAQSAPSLPVAEAGGIVGRDPRFKAAASGDYSVGEGSPAIGRGLGLPQVRADLDQRCYGAPPTVGAFEPRDTPLQHSDADRMPDWWEDRFGLNRLDPADGGLDPDQDRQTNEAEYLGGTDPTDPESHLHVAILGREAGALWMRHPSVADRLYVAESSGVIDGRGWIQSPLGRGTGDSMSFRAVLPPNVAALFVRVRAEWP